MSSSSGAPCYQIQILNITPVWLAPTSRATQESLYAQFNRILIVDDDHITLSLLVAGEARGLPECGNGKNRRDSLKISCPKPHIVFSILKCRNNGIETLRAIKEYGITTQIVMVSATATADRVSAAREAGAAGFIVKPASQKRIGDAIRSCLKLRSQEEGDIELFVLS
jgi:DNA-binding NtrC family response regulator